MNPALTPSHGFCWNSQLLGFHEACCLKSFYMRLCTNPDGMTSGASVPSFRLPGWHPCQMTCHGRTNSSAALLLTNRARLDVAHYLLLLGTQTMHCPGLPEQKSI